MPTEPALVESPLGPIAIALDRDQLCALEFDDSDPDRPRPRATGPVADRLRAYFAGDLDALDSIPVAPAGTAFQLRVWQALRRIPAGRTRSYQEIAAEIGAPAAIRAVGAANGKNPISLVIPCHRVIASTGKLHGYGGGLWRKEWLLRHEGALPPELPALFARPGATLPGS
jgi:methylated-DNA-[protein]-cysteine S-methyltransferase